MIPNQYSGFWAALFYQGHLDSCNFWPSSDLSGKWASFCRQMIQTHPPNFTCTLEGPLTGIEVKATSSGSAVLITLSASGHVSLSVLLLTGERMEAEAELTQMFVDSLRRSATALAVITTTKPFEKLFNLKERPLMAAVLWPHAPVDHELLSELGLHFAEAYFRLHAENYHASQ